MLESRNCEKYGKDQDFLNWRWKPHGCDLPRFDAGEFLRMVKGKTMFFVGDSLARNHVESLLCLLSQVEKPMNVHKDKEDTSNIWYFNSSNFTIKSNFIKFLVQATERTINGTKTGVFDIHMDKVDTEWANKLHKTHYIVISTSHWFFRKNYFYENGKLIGCTFCSETNLKEINFITAIKKATRTALEFIKNSTHEEHHFEFKTLTLLRTYSPAHFEGGAWNDGGYCNRTRPLKAEEMLGVGDMELRNGQVEELDKVKEGEGEFGVVDVTESMMVRADGHPGKHWNDEWMKGFNDCTHWCLPGAVDVWNDMMLQVMKRFSSF
ncbi:protein ALTERED XYLOGLUCAN 4-like [Dioscorea cayenensis subsp. rotundata]|uniref:Protein ALTERED XYLOGLUCAN 4-like n=1 Tax=Dioscorea cayennensis subsp. rotundata TaxID=55577 RepID=A0AB40BVF7_DIOCR|nr:protein ALTERED XYLOGLUCAN 4-like [Dioscorea cayenensis subsp. rotundata]